MKSLGFCLCSSLRRLDDGSLFFYLSALSSFLISLYPRLTYVCFLLLFYRCIILLVVPRHLCGSLITFYFSSLCFFTAKITYLSVWLPHILSVRNDLKETSVPIPCRGTGNLLESRSC